MAEDLVEQNRGRLAAISGSVVLFLLSWFWMFRTYLTIEEDFSAADTWIISSIVLVSLSLQIALIAASYLIRRAFLAPALMSAIFIVINVFTLNLIMNAEFMALSYAWMSAVILGALFVAFTVIRMAAESRVLRRLIFVVLAFLSLSPAAQAILNRNATAESPSVNSSQVVQNIEFLTRPNVYFIGFESMAPQSVLSKYLQYDDSPLLEAINTNNFRAFENLFAERVPTRRAITSLLALDRETYENASKTGYPLMSGSAPSPLLQIFKHNGYETNTLYHRAYFGERSGPYVDNYRVNQAFSICSMMEERELEYAFFGACRLYEQTNWKDLGKIQGGQIDFLIHAMEEIARKQTPQFLLAHHGPPQHTAKDFSGRDSEIADFREKYRRSSESASKNLDRIVTFISQNDPEALLFVFGDHGTWLSRRIDWSAAEQRDEKEFYVQDRFAVAGGVYPSAACEESFKRPYNDNFTTVPQVARMIIRCLAGGVDAFDSSYEHTLMIGGEQHEYVDYLYE